MVKIASISEKVNSVIENRSSYAQWITKEITHICRDLPKRSPGSEGERMGGEYMAGVLKDLGCEDIKIEQFKENPGSFYGWIYITFVLVFAGYACLFFAPVISVILIACGLVLFVMQFLLYRKFIDKLFKEKTGTNVSAVKKCTGETKRRIVFNGHIDAAWEFTVNHLFGGVAYDLHIIFSVVGVFYFLFIAIITIIRNGAISTLADDSFFFKATLIGIIFIPFQIGMFFMSNSRVVVDGANDNLTGCYMGIGVVKAMVDEGIELENTEVVVLLTGSEEAGLRGAKAWTEAHKGEYDDVPTFVYSYDTIHDPKYLMVNYRDLNATVAADKDVSDLFMETAEELGIPCMKGSVPPFGGATDSAAFCQGGFRSTGVTGLSHTLEDYYHTRRDTWDNLNEEGIGNCFAVTMKVLEKFDNGAKQ